MNKIFIGSDKSGYELKEKIIEYLNENAIIFEDIGTTDVDNPLPFFNVARSGAQKIQSKEFEQGILICGTGMGMSVVANKFEGVYAAACESLFSAQKCRAINDANILCMGGWIVGPMLGIAMTKAFMTTQFTQDLEDWRANNLRKAKIAVKDIEFQSFKHNKL